MADHPLRPARDRRLGEPLPHQQANLTQAHLIARASREALFLPKEVYGINPSFPGLSPSTGQIPTRYSPVRRSTHIRRYFLARLACVKPTASVQSEP